MRMILAAILAAAMATAGWAAEGDGKTKWEKRGKRGGDPAARLGRWLDLTPEQSTKLKAVMTANRKSTRDLRDKRQDATRALRNLLEDKGSDAQITAKLNDLKAADDALLAAHQKHRDEMSKILTPVQRAKFVLGMGRPGKAGRKPGMGGDRRGEGPGENGPMAFHDTEDGD